MDGKQQKFEGIRLKKKYPNIYKETVQLFNRTGKVLLKSDNDYFNAIKKGL